MNPNRWIEGINLKLIRGAARRAPASLSQRLEEEWLADLAARRGMPARLRFALDCCRATRVIALELGDTVGTAAATGGKSAALIAESGPLLPRRTTAVVLIGALHVLVILGLASGMAHTVSPAAPRIQATFLKAAPHTVTPPAFGAPAIVHVAPRDPQPPPILRTGEDADGAAAATAVTGPPPTVAVAPRISRVTGAPAEGFPNTADYYPASAIRLNEKGVAMVHVCVNESGRLTAEPVIAQSSGSSRLDAGALRLARAGSGHYQPSTEDGRPVSSCYSFAVRFQLQY